MRTCGCARVCGSLLGGGRRRRQASHLLGGQARPGCAPAQHAWADAPTLGCRQLAAQLLTVGSGGCALGLGSCPSRVLWLARLQAAREQHPAAPPHPVAHEAVVVEALLQGGADCEVHPKFQLQRLPQQVGAAVPEALHGRQPGAGAGLSCLPTRTAGMRPRERRGWGPVRSAGGGQRRGRPRNVRGQAPGDRGPCMQQIRLAPAPAQRRRWLAHVLAVRVVKVEELERAVAFQGAEQIPGLLLHLGDQYFLAQALADAIGNVQRRGHALDALLHCAIRQHNLDGLIPLPRGLDLFLLTLRILFEQGYAFGVVRLLGGGRVGPRSVAHGHAGQFGFNLGHGEPLSDRGGRRERGESAAAAAHDLRADGRRFPSAPPAPLGGVAPLRRCECCEPPSNHLDPPSPPLFASCGRPRQHGPGCTVPCIARGGAPPPRHPAPPPASPGGGGRCQQACGLELWCQRVAWPAALPLERTHAKTWHRHATLHRLSLVSGTRRGGGSGEARVHHQRQARTAASQALWCRGHAGPSALR